MKLLLTMRFITMCIVLLSLGAIDCALAEFFGKEPEGSLDLLLITFMSCWAMDKAGNNE